MWRRLDLLRFCTSRLDDRCRAADALSPTPQAVASSLYNPTLLPLMITPRGDAQCSSQLRLDSQQVIDTMSLWDDRLPITGGFRRQMIGVTDPATNANGLDGGTRIRGLELATYGEAFYDAQLQNTAGGATDGNQPVSAPQFIFNLGADYELPWLPGLGVNARVIYTGAQYYNATNTLRLPSWTRYDIGARYSTRVASKNVVFRANVENLFGSRYWIQQGTYVSPAAPRTLLLSAQIDF